MPLVSILIRTFSRPAQLERAVRSVLSQTYRPLQLVIVNDGGTDVRQQAEAWLAGSNDIELAYLNQPHLGRSAAANQALELAQGEYLLFLDDDDWIAPEHIDHLVTALVSHQELIAAYSDTVCVESEARQTILRTYETDFDRLRLVSENYLPIHAVLFRRMAVDSGCRFDPALHLYEDWHFWIQVVQLGDMLRVKERSAYYCMDDSGVGGQHNQDFNEAYLAFIRSITPLLTDEQLIHLHYALRALENAKQVITQLQEDDNKTREVLKATLERENQTKSELKLLESAHQSLEHKYNHTVINIRAIRYYCSRLRRKFGSFVRLLSKGDFRTLHSSARHNLLTVRRLFRGSRPVVAPPSKGELEPGLDILTTPHTRHVADLIKDTLERLSGLDAISPGPVNIITGTPATFSNRLYIVICPQMYDRLPNQYIAFQMEQTVNSRWLTADYIMRLQQAQAVLDYSTKNIEYFTRSGELPFEKVFHVPISNRLIEHGANSDYEYDIAFYGDPNSPRRQRFLQELDKHFKLLIIKETFGEKLIEQLSRAAVVVNIHYYEGALLETTRLYECLSHGFRVVSETSIDIDEHAALRDWIDLTPIDDPARMVELITRRLHEIRSGMINLRLQGLPEDLAAFGYHFTRALVAQGLAAPEALSHFSPPLPSVKDEQAPVRLGLSLPETPRRRHGFQEHFPFTPVFPGIRHTQGWRGAALSYKYLAQWGMAKQLPYLEILEDDAFLGPDSEERWRQARTLFLENGSYDILCGLVADLSANVRVLNAFEHKGQKYIVIDRMVSMVCNGYAPQALRLLSNWAYEEDDVDKNTIDRYLEAHTLRVLVPLPFIATHLSEHQSTLWKFNNTTYDEMIHDSEQRLLALYEAHLDSSEKIA